MARENRNAYATLGREIVGVSRAMNRTCAAVDRICTTHCDKWQVTKRITLHSRVIRFVFGPCCRRKGRRMEKRKNELCSEYITLRTTPAEKVKLTALSQKTGLNVSETIRALLAAAEVVEVASWAPSLGGK